MKSYKRHLYIAATFILFITALVFSSINTGHSAPMADRDVWVINTTTEPVPTAAQGTTNVAGNVSITNTPTVTAQQNGAWIVGISNSPTVEIGNSVTSPVPVRDVDNPARQPFQANAFQPFDTPLVTVPAGKRLVVEFVSGVVRTPFTPDRPELTLRSSGGFEHLIALLVWPNDSALFQFSQPLRMYVDAGDSLFVKSGDSANASVHVTGHFIDVP